MAEDFNPLKNEGAIVKADGDDTIIAQGITAPSGEVTFTDGTSGTVPLSSLVPTVGREPAISGIVGQASGDMSVGAGPGEVDFVAGKMILITRDAEGIPSEFVSTWSTQTKVSTNLAAAGSVWVLTDVGHTGTATIEERTSVPVGERETVELGVSIHLSGAIAAVANLPVVHRDMIWLANDMFKATHPLVLASGTINEIAATLTFSRTDFVLTGRWINFRNSITNSNNLTLIGVALQTFTTVDTDGTEFNVGITVVPKTFNSSGTETALSGQNAAVHQVVIFPNGICHIQLGTEAKKDFQTAVSEILKETVENPLHALARAFGIRAGYIVISAQTTTLWEDGKAHIFPALDGGTGVGAPGITTYDELTDTEDDKTGNALKLVRVNAAEDKHEYVDPSVLAAGSIASLELVLSTDSIAVSTTPGPIGYNVTDSLEHIQGFFTYSSPTLTCQKACFVRVHVRADYSVNINNTVAGLRLDVRKNGGTVQVFDEQSEKSTDRDGQSQGFVDLHLVATDTIVIYCNSYVTGQVDVWGGPNRVNLLVLEDLS